VVSVEIDERLTGYLRQRYADDPTVEIVEGDFLNLTPGDLLGADAADYVVVANLPYYITTAIVRHLLESDSPPRRLVITVQREVGERMAAGPGDMSLLAVSVQFYGRPQVVTRLSAGNFYPRPKVESAVVRIDPHPDGPPVPKAEADSFFRVVRAGFSQPRKQVKNSLSAGLAVDGAAAVRWLEAAGLDPRARPETLSVGDWVDLYQAIRAEEHQP
jgi:16S rRNA (adenine1518-N6/adenine1519-N6)-dimethyltransferase